MPNTKGNERDMPQVLRIYSQSRCRILLVPSAHPRLELLRFFLLKTPRGVQTGVSKLTFRKRVWTDNSQYLPPPYPYKSANGDRISDISLF